MPQFNIRILFISIFVIYSYFYIKPYECAREFDDEHHIANRIEQNSQQYWKTVTEEFIKTYNNQNILQKWHQVRGEMVVHGNVSDKCLNVLTRIIENPLSEEWSARRK